MEPDQYKPPVLAKIFHRLPHLNITLHYVNSTFVPKSTVYLESLGILASVPALWLILTLFLLLIYLCTRCCDRKPRPKQSISLLKWTLSIFTILCCGALAVGLYGNDDVHNAVLQFVASVKAVDEIITSVKNKTGEIEETLQKKVDELLTRLSVVFEDPVANQTARALLLVSLGSVKGNTTTALSSCIQISRPLQGIDLRLLMHWIQLPETIRWPTTMGVLVVFLLFCVILLFGVARHSRCCLILFSVFGLFAVIVNWLLTSIYLASSVALGDLCVAPEDYLRSESPNALEAEILKYYMRCDPSLMNPFTQRLREAQRAVDAMTANLNVVTRIAHELYRSEELSQLLKSLTRNINYTKELVSGLAARLDCRQLHTQYLIAARSVCDLGLYGLAFMLLASVSAGLLFTVLVWVDSHTWIYIRKRRDYLQVSEQDPFLPPSGAASQAIAARTLRHQGSYHGPPTPPASPRYTPLPTAPTFRERLRDPSVAGSVYYEPTIPTLDPSQVPETNPQYEYYSSIPMHSDLTSERRGWNYNSRDSELVANEAPEAWMAPSAGFKHSPSGGSEQRRGWGSIPREDRDAGNHWAPPVGYKYSPSGTMESRWKPR